MNHEVFIAQNENLTYTFTIDNQDVSGVVSNLKIEVGGAGKPAEITCELTAAPLFRAFGQVELDATTRAMLLKLGWTPPNA